MHLRKDNLVIGNDKDELKPGDNASRAEAAVMLLRILRFMEYVNYKLSIIKPRWTDIQRGLYYS